MVVSFPTEPTNPQDCQNWEKGVGEQLHKVPHGIKCLVDKVWYLIHCVLKVWHFEHTIDQICCYWYSSSWNVEEWNIKLSMLITFVSPVISLCRKYFCLGKVNILSLAMILLAVVTLSLCFMVVSTFMFLCFVPCVFLFHMNVMLCVSLPQDQFCLLPKLWNHPLLTRLLEQPLFPRLLEQHVLPRLLEQPLQLQQGLSQSAVVHN